MRCPRKRLINRELTKIRIRICRSVEEIHEELDRVSSIFVVLRRINKLDRMKLIDQFQMKRIKDANRIVSCSKIKLNQIIFKRSIPFPLHFQKYGIRKVS